MFRFLKSTVYVLVLVGSLQACVDWKTKPNSRSEPSDTAYKLTSSECTDPDLSKLSTASTFMACDGSIMVGTMANCSSTVTSNCFSTGDFYSIDKTKLDADNFLSSISIAGVTGTIASCNGSNATGCLSTTSYPSVKVAPSFSSHTQIDGCSYKLEWNAISGAHKVFLMKKSGSTWQVNKELSGTDDEVLLTGLSPSTSYTYALASLNTDGSFLRDAVGTTFTTSAATCGPTNVTPTMWFSAGSGISISSGTSIASWTDFSGNHSLLPGASKPTLTASGINSLPMVSFVSPQFLQFASDPVAQSSTYTIVLVSKVYAGQTLIALRGSTAPLIQIDNGLTPRFIVRDSANVTATVTVGSALTSGDNVIITAKRNGGTISLHVNGALIGTNTQTFTGNFNTTSWLLSALNSGTYSYSTTDQAEVAIYPSALSTPQQEAVECYFSSKYGISLSGPSC